MSTCHTEHGTGRLALERGPSRWDLDIRQWSADELRHAYAVIRDEVDRRRAEGTWREADR